MSDNTVGYQVRYPSERHGVVLDTTRAFSERTEAVELYDYLVETIGEGGVAPVMESRVITYGEWEPAK